MTTQKTFKRRVRARAARTGESYTSARAQLLRRADARRATGVRDSQPAPAPASDAPDPTVLAGMADEALERGSGRRIAEWIDVLDAWGARERRHPEIARWLSAEHGIGGWWAQTVTVAYERARGMRAVHQQPTGFAVGASRTIAAAPDRALRAFTDARRRARWLPDVELSARRTTAASTARFDVADPPSRLVVHVDPKPDGRSVVSVSHERLPDADTAERVKAAWRERLGVLKARLEDG